LENSKRKSGPMIKPSQLGEKDIVSSEMAIDKFLRVSSLHGTILLSCWNISHRWRKRDSQLSE